MLIFSNNLFSIVTLSLSAPVLKKKKRMIAEDIQCYGETAQTE